MSPHDVDIPVGGISIIADAEMQSTRRRTGSVSSNSSKLSTQQPVIDLAVAAVSIPTIVIFGLLLETNMEGDWAQDTQSRYTVMGLAIGLLIISMLICGYVTHRMGVCLWAGPLDDSDVYASRMNSDNNADEFIDIYPPSYETVMGYDVPPPAYHTCTIKTNDINLKLPIPVDETTHI